MRIGPWLIRVRSSHSHCFIASHHMSAAFHFSKYQASKAYLHYETVFDRFFFRNGSCLDDLSYSEFFVSALRLFAFIRSFSLSRSLARTTERTHAASHRWKQGATHYNMVPYLDRIRVVHHANHADNHERVRLGCAWTCRCLSCIQICCLLAFMHCSIDLLCHSHSLQRCRWRKSLSLTLVRTHACLCEQITFIVIEALCNVAAFYLLFPVLDLSDSGIWFAFRVSAFAR
jgi:hypothetical protein